MTSKPPIIEDAGAILLVESLHRVCRGQGRAFVSEPPPEPVRRPARVAKMLALAHALQRAIDEGRLRDQADVARRLGLTRARVTQLLNLIFLAPDLQDAVLVMDAVDGIEPLTERRLRGVMRAGTWAHQREAWRLIV